MALVEDGWEGGRPVSPYVASQPLRALLQEQGMEVRSLNDSLDLESYLLSTSFLALTGYFFHPSPGDVAAVLDWLRTGGSLFLIGDIYGMGSWDGLASRLGISSGQVITPQEAYFSTLEEHPVTQGLLQIRFLLGTNLVLCGPKGVAFTNQETQFPPGAPVIAVSTWGLGRMVTVGDGNSVNAWGYNFQPLLLENTVDWLESKKVGGTGGPHPPIASFTCSTSTDGSSMAFDGTASVDVDGTITSYAWNFGDGTFGEGPKVEHSYVDTGEFDVSLSVVNQDGLTDTYVTAIIVPPSQVSALNGFTGDLDLARELLQDSLDELQATLDVVDSARRDLENSQGTLPAMDIRTTLLIGGQTAFILSTAVLFVLYWNARKSVSGPGVRHRIRRSVQAWRVHNSGAHRESQTFARRKQSQSSTVYRSWPGREESGPLYLTSKERILIHLFEYREEGDQWRRRAENTQGGIREKTGIDSRHFAQYVRPLIEEGLVRKSSAHVRDVQQRRQVYDLTETGRKRAQGILVKIRSVEVCVRYPSGWRNLSLAEALETRREGSLLDVIREAIGAGQQT